MPAAPSGPSSWAEDLQSYRSQVGANSFATLKDTPTDEYFRIPRTTMCPMGDYSHPLFPYGDKPFIPDAKNGGDFRYDRHGWGDDSLLKEEGIPPGTLHRHAQEVPSGRKPVPPPAGAGDRDGLFGVLQMTEQGRGDSWIGNQLIDPTKGKRDTPAPVDAKGRRGLFTTLGQTEPCLPKDDTWLGNILIDPAKGKAYAPGPEKRLGRQDLYGIVQQGILMEPDRAGKMVKGGDGALTDAWVGNRLVHPDAGKRAPSGEVAVDNLFGTAYRPHVGDTDFPRVGKKTVPAEVMPRQHYVNQVGPILDGTSGVDDWAMGRSVIPARAENRPANLDGRKDLYRIMCGAEVSAEEARLWGASLDDQPKRECKRILRPAPGEVSPDTGPDMLCWKPNERIASYVPYGKLMQLQRGISRASVPHSRTVFPTPGPRTRQFEKV